MGVHSYVGDIMRYKIVVSYNGNGFCGWQSQPSGNSVQQAIENACCRLFCEKKVSVVGSGRTDAGVHALRQTAHFDCQKVLPLKNVVSGLNAYLPPSVRVIKAEYVNVDFDARKSAKQKTYMYLTYVGDDTPVLNDRAMHVKDNIDIDRMNEAAKLICGTRDFASFMATGSSAKTSVRTVYDLHIEREGAFVKLFITANGFLYNMVRIIAALLFKIGEGENIDVIKVLESRDRRMTAQVAPPQGLYLYDVEY